MFNRRLVMLATVATLGALAVAPPMASAATTVLRTDLGNVQLPQDSTITGTSEGPAVITLPGLGSISCHTNFSATFVSSHGEGSVGGALRTFTMTPCTDTIPVINFDHCAPHGPSALTIAADAGAGTFTIHDLWLYCHSAATLIPGQGCYYTASTVSGHYTNASSTLAIVDVPIVHAPGGTLNDLATACGNNGSLRANFADVHTSAGTLTVTTT